MNEVDILGIDLGTTNSAIAIWERVWSKAVGRCDLRFAAALRYRTHRPQGSPNFPNFQESLKRMRIKGSRGQALLAPLLSGLLAHSVDRKLLR